MTSEGIVYAIAMASAELLRCIQQSNRYIAI